MVGTAFFTFYFQFWGSAGWWRRRLLEYSGFYYIFYQIRTFTDHYYRLVMIDPVTSLYTMIMVQVMIHRILVHRANKTNKKLR